MTDGFPRSPRLVKGGLVLVDPDLGAVQRVITLQYNPDSLSRTLQLQGVSGGGDRSEALRLKGPPVETIKVEAEIDATDQLEDPRQHPDAVSLGLHPQLAALETIAYPASSTLILNEILAAVGTIEILPAEAPLTLFVWSAQRILPVRMTELGIVEEAFDPALNPIRVKVSLGLRVLSIDDLPFTSRGGSLFMAYLRAKERLAARSPVASLSSLGIGGIG
jgi:hypothetical protein